MFWVFTRIGSPGRVRNMVSVRSRTATWSDSGIPSSIPITRIGTTLANSATISKVGSPTSSSRQRAQKSRIWSSSAAMRRGLKTRDMSPRCSVCSGGSSNITTPGGSSTPALMMSRMSLRVFENTRQSMKACSTSA